MDKTSLILASFYPAGAEPYTPVQTQKLIFLVQNKLPSIIEDGYDFQPYDYGPFDKEIYTELRKLKDEGFIIINDQQRTWPLYSLSGEGVEKAGIIYNKLDNNAKDVIKKLSTFVRSLSFSQLVSAVYKAYPEMRENSIYKE